MYASKYVYHRKRAIDKSVKYSRSIVVFIICNMENVYVSGHPIIQKASFNQLDSKSFTTI